MQSFGRSYTMFIGKLSVVVPGFGVWMFHEQVSIRSATTMLALSILLAMPGTSKAQTSLPGPVVVSSSVDEATGFSPPHEIIRSPRLEHQGTPVNPSSSHVRSSTNPVYPLPHLIHQQTLQPGSAVIHGAAQREVWKTPFSYGYFGASGSRHWIRHYGYRDRDKEWRLR